MPIEPASDEQDDRVEQRNVMVKIAGKSFRCVCGANVFAKLRERTADGDQVYECNGCETNYAGA